jgi:hypothetical protein
LRILVLLTILISASGWASRAARADPPGAQDALLRFEAELESHDSATEVLQAWCDAHGPSLGTRIVARSVRGPEKPPPPLARRSLGLTPARAVRYRRVDLTCGDKVLSQADNWYLPNRLTSDMNRRLEQTQTPFGVVVKPLNFTRRNLETVFLFRGGTSVPRHVLRHAAVLLSGEGIPFSFVVETYTDQVLNRGRSSGG